MDHANRLFIYLYIDLALNEQIRVFSEFIKFASFKARPRFSKQGQCRVPCHDLY